MNVTVNENGYLVVDDVVDGIKIMSSARYDSMVARIKELEDELRDAKCEARIYNKRLDKSEMEKNQLILTLGAMYDRLDTVRRAHYLEGYSDGAWQTHHRSLNANCKNLQRDVKDFPALLESTLHDIVGLFDSTKKSE